MFGKLFIILMKVNFSKVFMFYIWVFRYEGINVKLFFRVDFVEFFIVKYGFESCWYNIDIFGCNGINFIDEIFYFGCKL